MVEVNLLTKRADLIRRTTTNCTNCALHLSCISPTPPSLPTITTPELLIVGEAPGGTEERAGEPFIGAAGTFIFRWIKTELGLHRKQCWIANSVACRPTAANKGKTNRAPNKTELDRCRDNLARVVDLYKRSGGEWVLLLGATALKSFVDEARIGSWAGKPFVLKHRDGLLSFMASYHPAAALRDPGYTPTIRRHLNYLAVLRKDTTQWWDKCFCGKEVAVYDGMGIAWCEKHRGLRRGERRVVEVRMKQERMIV